jgi:hypothetical protein
VSWKDRLQKDIILTSPEGTLFRPQWVGDPRSFKKNIAVFDAPGVKGVRFQDLEFGLTITPLTLYFAGEDNDIDAGNFFKACKEKGTWFVTHPVKGFFRLQLSSVSEGIAPVDSGGLTVVNTVWFETGADAVSLLSLAEKASDVNKKGELINESSAEQFQNNVDLSRPSLLAKFRNEVADIADYVRDKVSAITNTLAEANAAIESVRRGITETISQDVIDILSLAGQIQTLVQSPARISGDLITRLNVYSDMINNSFSEIIFIEKKTGSKEEDKNRAAVQELFLASAMSSEAEILVSQPAQAEELPETRASVLQTRSRGIETRAQTIDAINTLIDDFSTITNNLDTIQGFFDDRTMDLQFFSQSISYKELSETVTLAISQALDVSFDLAIEKRFILEKPRAPIEIALKEYNGPGVNDDNLIKFINANNLHGRDMLLLKAGVEVVVYV